MNSAMENCSGIFSFDCGEEELEPCQQETSSKKTSNFEEVLAFINHFKSTDVSGKVGSSDKRELLTGAIGSDHSYSSKNSLVNPPCKPINNDYQRKVSPLNVVVGSISNISTNNNSPTTSGVNIASTVPQARFRIVSNTSDDYKATYTTAKPKSKNLTKPRSQTTQGVNIASNASHVGLHVVGIPSDISPANSSTSNTNSKNLVQSYSPSTSGVSIASNAQNVGFHVVRSTSNDYTAQSSIINTNSINQTQFYSPSTSGVSIASNTQQYGIRHQLPAVTPSVIRVRPQSQLVTPKTANYIPVHVTINGARVPINILPSSPTSQTGKKFQKTGQNYLKTKDGYIRITGVKPVVPHPTSTVTPPYAVHGLGNRQHPAVTPSAQVRKVGVPQKESFISIVQPNLLQQSILPQKKPVMILPKPDNRNNPPFVQTNNPEVVKNTVSVAQSMPLLDEGLGNGPTSSNPEPAEIFWQNSNDTGHVEDITVAKSTSVSASPAKGPEPIISYADPTSAVNLSSTDSEVSQHGIDPIATNKSTQPSAVSQARLNSPSTKVKQKRLDSLDEQLYPSLLVTTQTSLSTFAPHISNNERFLLDSKVMKILSMKPSDFVEYLLQKRLLPTEQFCQKHGTKLRLGIQSDSSKFPHSGGYVWIGECCTGLQRSVFSGSIFEKLDKSPLTIVKLMYHWACNTSILNVMKWVKTTSRLIKTYYTHFRAICISVVQEKSELLGGNYNPVEVALINVERNIVEAHMPSVVKPSVAILLAFDPVHKRIRLAALDSVYSASSKSVMKRGYGQVLPALKNFVNVNSHIVCDESLVGADFKKYGFLRVSKSGADPNLTNAAAHSYLHQVKGMFNKVSHLLSLKIIQQFLDELVWRETWGPCSLPSQAFDNFSLHLAEMTMLPGPHGLIEKLSWIISLPRANWKFSSFINEPKQNTWTPKVPPVTHHSPPVTHHSPPQKTKAERVKVDKTKAEKVTERKTVSTPRQPSEEFLEQFFYGTAYVQPRVEEVKEIIFKCFLCSFTSSTSLEFTSHLVMHAANNKTSYSPSLKRYVICELCYKPVKDLKAHEMGHFSSVEGSVCKICLVSKENRAKLLEHMNETHCELDMPYNCELCSFQTSIYFDMMSHFIKSHSHRPYVKCPFCFKCVNMFPKNPKLSARNQLYFLEHIQKHMQLKLAQKCEKCTLTFSSVGNLNEHVKTMHQGPKNGAEVKRWGASAKMRIHKSVTLPLDEQEPVDSSQSSSLGSFIKLPRWTNQKICGECDSPILKDHFYEVSQCTFCWYKTSCYSALRIHQIRSHPASVQIPNPSQFFGNHILQNEFYDCSHCDFSSRDGNEISSHMLVSHDNPCEVRAIKRKSPDEVSAELAEKVLKLT